MIALKRLRNLIALTVLFAPFAAPAVMAQQDDFERWELLKNPFPSTGGGGIMIHDYNPVVTGNKCVTNFSAIEPSGKAYYNIVEFDAVPVQGGTLCTNGAWRAIDGSANGTTPFRVFLKNGVARGSP
jgi:hypothetical protein